MRHIGWAATWIVVGLAFTLGTASVLTLRATVQNDPAPPVAAPAGPGPAPDARPRLNEPGRKLVLTSHRRYASK